MGKEVDYEALACQYIWEHLKKLNIGTPTLRRWRSSSLRLKNPIEKKAVLFTMLFYSVKEHICEEFELPVAILTEDGILRYLIGSGTDDLKEYHSHCIG